MSVCKTARFSVRPERLEECLEAIREFVDHIKANEPGTRLYASFQGRDDAHAFLHVMIFDDAEAEARHRSSDAVRRFTGVIYPASVGGVAFADFAEVASTH